MPARISRDVPVAISSRTVGVRNRHDIVMREPEIVDAHDLVLAHRNAAGDLREIFAEGRRHDQLFDFAEALFMLERARPAHHLAQRFDIGREPGEPVRGALLAIERRRVDAAVFAQIVAQTSPLALASKPSAARTASSQ